MSYGTYRNRRRARHSEMLRHAEAGLAIMPPELLQRLCRIDGAGAPAHLPTRRLKDVAATWGITAATRRLEAVRRGERISDVLARESRS